MAVTTTSPVATTNYLFGLSLDKSTYYGNNGPASTTSGTAAVYTGLNSIDFLYINCVLNTDQNVYSMDFLGIMKLAMPYLAKYAGSLI